VTPQTSVSRAAGAGAPGVAGAALGAHDAVASIIPANMNTINDKHTIFFIILSLFLSLGGFFDSGDYITIMR
jgi:hypothetical protein